MAVIEAGVRCVKTLSCDGKVPGGEYEACVKQFEGEITTSSGVKHYTFPPYNGCLFQTREGLFIKTRKCTHPSVPSGTPCTWTDVTTPTEAERKAITATEEMVKEFK